MAQAKEATGATKPKQSAREVSAEPDERASGHEEPDPEVEEMLPGQKRGGAIMRRMVITTRAPQRQKFHQPRRVESNVGSRQE